MEVVAFKTTPFGEYIELSLMDKVNNEVFVADQLMMKKYNEGTVVKSPITLDYNAAQKLMDTLWDCGIRPSEGHGSAGQKAAIEKHLNDMRKIVAKKLNINL